MSEEAKELQKKLFNKKENGVDFMSEEELKACDEFCEGYKKFLFENKTEREFAKAALALAKEHGFVEFDKFGKPLKAKFIISTGARQLFLQSRAKGLFVTE